MVKRSKTAPPPRPDRAPAPVVAFRAAILLLALVLTAVGVQWLRGVWQQLPGNAAARINWDAVKRARQSISGDGREGRILLILSDHVTQALHEPERIPLLLDDARQGMAMLRRSDLGRLHVATLVILQLQDEGAAPKLWWPAVQRYLGGLDNASFDHYMPAYVAAESALYERYGVAAGSAQALVLAGSAGAHGPFLQVFTQQMATVRVALRDAGEVETAAMCRRLVRRLLRAFLLESAPAGLRLIAADLLATEIEAHTEEATAVEHEIAAKCRAWRAAYHGSAAGMSVAPMPVRVTDVPMPTETGGALGTRLLLATWLAAAAAAVALFTIATAGVWLLRPEVSGDRIRPGLAVAMVSAALILGVGWLLLGIAPGWGHSEILRINEWGSDRPQARPLGTPWWPIVAAVVGLGVLLVGRIAVQKVTAWRLLVPPAWLWLALAVLLLAVTWSTERAREAHDEFLARPLDAHTEAVADPDHAGLLADLRAWKP